MSVPSPVLRAAAMAAVLGGTLATAPAHADPIRIAYGDIASMEAVPVLAAFERAKEKGLDLEVIYVQSKEMAGQVVVSGQAEIGIGIPYAIIQKVDTPTRMFLQMSKLNYYPIVSAEHYQDWEDLDGEEIAVHSRGSGTEAIIQLIADKHGIEFSRITYVPGSEVRAGAMLQGVIKASVVDSANLRMLMEEAPGRFVALPMDAASATDEGLFASQEFIEREAEAIDILVEAVLTTLREVAERPEVVVELREQYGLLPDLPEGIDEEMVQYFTELAEENAIPVNGGGESAARDDLAFYALSGQLEGDPASLEVEDFWDLEPLERALGRLGTS